MTSQQYSEILLSQDAEITRDEALRSLLTNEKFSDLTLRGLDGTLVIANRCLLASRSPFFGRMLFGKFAEASKKIICLGYDGAVLQAIVDYIYTDTVAALEELGSDYDETKWDIDLIQFFATLVDAANYFALPELGRKIERAAVAQMKQNHDIVTIVLAACAPDYEATRILRDRALDMVKSNPKLLVEGSHSAVAMIHPSNVEEIIKDDTLPVDEYSCFQILETWATAEPTIDLGLNDMEERDWRNSRKRVASQMTNHIDLAGIDPSELSTTVTSSGLVTAEQLADAYKEQALRVQKGQHISFTQWRGRHVWKSSGTNTFEQNGSTYCTESLACPVLTSGVHKWSVKVLRGGTNNIILGAASTRWPIETSDVALDKQPGGWALYNGYAYHAKSLYRTDLPRFLAGSIVSFTLDIERGGILTASINGNNPFPVFSGMCRVHGEGYGFVPAISVRDGSVEFLGFEVAS